MYNSLEKSQITQTSESETYVEQPSTYSVHLIQPYLTKGNLVQTSPTLCKQRHVRCKSHVVQTPAQPDNPTQRPLSARASSIFEFLQPFFLFFAFFRSGTRWHLFVRLPGPRDWFSTTALLLFLVLPRMSCGRIRVITQRSFETCSPLSLGIIRGRNGNLRIHI